MASTTLQKDTGILLLFLLGLLLPSALVSGQATTTSAPTATTTMASTASTMSSSTTASTAPSTPQSTTASGGSTATTPQSITASGGSTTAMSSPSATTTSSGPMSSTNSGTTSSAAMTQSSTSMATMSQASGSTMATATRPSTSSMSTSAGAMTTTMAPTSWSSTGATSGTNGTSNSTSMMSMISCPSFTCNYSDCYTMYTSQNVTSCPTGAYYCQLIKQADMCYTVGCSASCADPCDNSSKTNCSKNCCNSTDCLKATFASMMMTTTTMAMTTTRPVTTTAASSPQTTANNGNKCHAGKCTTTDCYKKFTEMKICTSSQLHCQLIKETRDSKVQWTAGCTTNCSGKASCKTSSTATPCHQECCNATKTSCLWLNGTLNVPSFATRGPHLHIELIAFLVCLLCISSLI